MSIQTSIMKKVLVAIILAATCLSMSAQNRSAKGRDWAKFSTYSEANAQLTTSPKVVFMGDSITEGWPKADPDFFTDNNFVGRGISGQTTSENLVRFRQDVLELKPKYVALMIGTNDIAGNNGIISQKNMLDNIKSMCELAKANKIKVLLCSVTPCKHYFWAPDVDCAQPIVELNKLIKAYADATKGVTYVDYFAVLNNGHNAMIPEYTLDECHLTPAGYKAIEKVILRYIK